MLNCKPNFTVVAESGKPTILVRNLKKVQQRRPQNTFTALSKMPVSCSSRIVYKWMKQLPQALHIILWFLVLVLLFTLQLYINFNSEYNAYTILQLWISEPALGQSMHFYPTISPPPLSPSTSMFLPSIEPESAHTPTPLVQQESRPSLSSPLWLCFVWGNILLCNGRKGKIGRQACKNPLPPTDDVVLHYRETTIFQNPNSGVFQASQKQHNVYYHAWKTCVPSHFSDFDPALHRTIEVVK